MVQSDANGKPVSYRRNSIRAAADALTCVAPPAPARHFSQEGEHAMDTDDTRQDELAPATNVTPSGQQPEKPCRYLDLLSGRQSAPTTTTITPSGPAFPQAPPPPRLGPIPPPAQTLAELVAQLRALVSDLREKGIDATDDDARCRAGAMIREAMRAGAFVGDAFRDLRRDIAGISFANSVLRQSCETLDYLGYLTSAIEVHPFEQLSRALLAVQDSGTFTDTIQPPEKEISQPALLAGKMGISELAAHLNIPEENREKMKKRLQRFRMRHTFNTEAFVEHDTPARNEAKYLYNANMVQDLLRDLAVK